MKIPTEIKIGAIVWKVKIVPSCEIDCDGICGDQSPITQTIRIAEEMTQEMKELTFIHEIIHCINSEIDHTEVEALAGSLYQVFTENYLLDNK